MTNNSVSFGSTKILYSENRMPVSYYIDKIRKYTNHKFGDIRGFNTLKQAEKELAPGQIGVVAGKDALILKGHNNIDDELIYKIVTDGAKAKLPGIDFVKDSLNIVG